MTDKMAEIGRIIESFIENVVAKNIEAAASLAKILHLNASMLSQEQSILVAKFTQIMLGEIENQRKQMA